MFLFSSIIASLVLHFILYDKNMLTKHKNMVLDGPGGFYRPNDPTNSVKYWMKEWSLTSGFNPTRLISQFYSKTTCKNTQNILNLSTVKLVGGYKDQPADMYELSIMIVHNWEQLCCTVQHGTVLILFLAFSRQTSLIRCCPLDRRGKNTQKAQLNIQVTNSRSSWKLLLRTIGSFLALVEGSWESSCNESQHLLYKFYSIFCHVHHT